MSTIISEIKETLIISEEMGMSAKVIMNINPENSLQCLAHSWAHGSI
jgi:hypothetical protein